MPMELFTANPVGPFDVWRHLANLVWNWFIKSPFELSLWYIRQNTHLADLLISKTIGSIVVVETWLRPHVAAAFGHDIPQSSTPSIVKPVELTEVALLKYLEFSYHNNFTFICI